MRSALGASRSEVVRMVVKQGARLTLVGIAIGLLAAALATRAMQSLLFEVDDLDPLTFAAAAAALAAAALLACYLPARKAARVVPIVALGR